MTDTAPNPTTTADAAPCADGTAVYGTVTVSFDVTGVVFSVTLAGVNTAAAPSGRPVAVSVACPVKPAFGSTVTVMSMVLPRSVAGVVLLSATPS